LAILFSSIPIPFEDNILNSNQFNGDFFTKIEGFGVLKQVQFSKVFSPYECFQELSMWLLNKKNSGIDTSCIISDKDRIAGHGFNDKSFRKRKN